jgi:hypothetical protein
VDQHIIEAREWLELLRAGTGHYEEFIHFIRESRLPLEEIGTTEQELADLHIKGCKIEAERLLDILRGSRRHSTRTRCYNELREKIASGFLSFEEIGTSKEELARLRPSTTPESKK